jgi:hypothetical protein
MKKKRAKSKIAASSKTAKKKGTSKKQKETHPAEVRKDLSLMVESEAAEMAQAVIEEGKKGQLGPVKYLLELAKIFPPSTDGSESSANEDSLAKTLLNRLNLPDEPIMRDDEDEMVTIKPALKVAAEEKADGQEACETEGEGRDNSVPVEGKTI